MLLLKRTHTHYTVYVPILTEVTTDHCWSLLCIVCGVCKFSRLGTTKTTLSPSLSVSLSLSLSLSPSPSLPHFLSPSLPLPPPLLTLPLPLSLSLSLQKAETQRGRPSGNRTGRKTGLPKVENHQSRRKNNRQSLRSDKRDHLPPVPAKNDRHQNRLSQPELSRCPWSSLRPLSLEPLRRIHQGGSARPDLGVPAVQEDLQLQFLSPEERETPDGNHDTRGSRRWFRFRDGVPGKIRLQLLIVSLTNSLGVYIQLLFIFRLAIILEFFLCVLCAL